MPINSFLYPAPSTPSFVYNVANSCRFDKGSSPSLSKTSGTPTNALKWTFSAWVKISGIANDTFLLDFNTDTNNRSQIGFSNDSSEPRIIVYEKVSGSTSQLFQTSALFRDPSAWLNIVVSCDRTLGTDTERTKIYVNGTRITSFASTPNYPAQNTNGIINTAVSTLIGKYSQSTLFYDGYMCEVVFIDGTAYAASDFGEFDEDSPTIWKPKDPSGLTFGTNGFYLDFEDSSNLGNDANGGTDFTETNIVAADQSTDTCTNNFATLNPIANGGENLTFSEGNTTVFNGDNVWRSGFSTFAVNSGKWYFEAKRTGSSANAWVGIVDTSQVDGTGEFKFNNKTRGYGYSASGEKGNSSSESAWANAYAQNDIVGIAVDFTNSKIYFSKNGTFQNSGDPTSGSTGTGSMYDIASGYDYFFATALYSSSAGFAFNFGSPSFAISSGNSDADGHGNFEHSVPSGYFSLCTKNLAEYGG